MVKDRLQAVNGSGNYHPTTEELVFGARVAWRNSNKCIGRRFWQSLHVVDARDVLDEKGYFLQKKITNNILIMRQIMGKFVNYNSVCFR